MSPELLRADENESTLKRSQLYVGANYGTVLQFLQSPTQGSTFVKVLLGAKGLGKTTLLRAALESIDGARTAFLVPTTGEPKEFIAYMLTSIGASSDGDECSARREFRHMLEILGDQQKRLVIAIDDAHKLPTATLESLGDVLDIDRNYAPYLQVIVAAEPGFGYMLNRPALGCLRRHIAGVETLVAMTKSETAEYISHYMAQQLSAGLPNDEMQAIAARSDGIPRNINWLCEEEIARIVAERRAGTPFLVSTANEATRIETADFATSGNANQIAQLCAWADERVLPWVGTMSELSTATGIAIEELADVVQKSAPELRRNGVEAHLERVPGRVRTIEFRRAEELTNYESHVANSPARGIVERNDGDSEAFGGGGAKIRPDTDIEADITRLRSEFADVVDAPEEADNSTTSRRRTLMVVGVCALIMTVVLVVGLAIYGSGLLSARKAKPTTPADTSSPGDAHTLLVRAAAAGDPKAQHKLAIQLASPDPNSGAPADLVSSYAWLLMAQARGEAVDKAEINQFTRILKPRDIGAIRNRLGQMYEHGVGCSADAVQADMWYLLGAATGDGASRSQSAALEVFMSAAKIKDAHNRAAKWLRQHTPASAQPKD